MGKIYWLFIDVLGFYFRDRELRNITSHCSAGLYTVGYSHCVRYSSQQLKAPEWGVICTQIMREDSALKLERLIFKEKLRNTKFWASVAVCVSLFGFVILGFSSDGAEKIVGQVIGTHTRMHDEGHTLYLMVDIPDRSYPVKVRLPKGQLIKKGAKIEINQINTLWFGKSRFSFSKYLE